MGAQGPVSSRAGEGEVALEDRDCMLTQHRILIRLFTAGLHIAAFYVIGLIYVGYKPAKDQSSVNANGSMDVLIKLVLTRLVFVHPCRYKVNPTRAAVNFVDFNMKLINYEPFQLFSKGESLVS